jgi:hypothetical protein
LLRKYAPWYQGLTILLLLLLIHQTHMVQKLPSLPIAPLQNRSSMMKVPCRISTSSAR